MKFWNTQLRLLILFQNKDANSLVSSVKMLSESQIVEYQTEIPNEIMCEKPSEPHRSFGMNPTTITRPMRKGEEIFNIDLENFSMPIPSKQIQQSLGYLTSNLQQWKH